MQVASEGSEGTDSLIASQPLNGESKAYASPAEGDVSPTEEAPAEPEQKLTVIELVQKALEMPAVRIGLIILVVAGVIAGAAAGAAYRAKKFKDQLK